MWVHTLFKKWRSCETITIVHSRWFKTPSNQRMALISKLLVGSSNNKISGSPNSACANNTRSFQPGATWLIGPVCCSIGMPTPISNSPARASQV